MATVYAFEGILLAEESYTVNKSVKSRYAGFTNDSEWAIPNGYKIIGTILQ